MPVLNQIKIYCQSLPFLWFSLYNLLVIINIVCRRVLLHVGHETNSKKDDPKIG